MRAFSIRRLLRHQGGAAAVEMALIAPLLAGLLGWIVSAAIEVNTQNAVREAVNSGALYVMRGGTDPDQIRDVALAAWSGPADQLAVAVTQHCSCGGVTASCTVLCADQSTPERFSRVRGQLRGDGSSFVSEQTVRTR